MSLNDLKKQFCEIFGNTEEIRVFHSPGRINLIGEHIDYNGGLVFPCALSFGTYALVSKRNDNILNLASTNFEQKIKIDINSIAYDEAHDWANYPKGVVTEILSKNCQISGLNILYNGNIPNGSGLSSSASIEVLTAVIFNEIFGLKISMMEIVKLSQRAENNFIGVMCGIMDQFAVGFGKKDNAILLDCKSLEYSYAAADLGDYKIVISNTKKPRALQESKYNERRSECEKALEILQTKLNISFLCDISKKEFDENSSLIKDETILKRAKHVVYENERVKEAVNALKDNDLILFGKLLNESHESLKNLYEVTGFELDTLAENARKTDGCIGARMTGAGFGGCTISIVHKDKIDGFIENLSKIYTAETSLIADFYIATIGDGAKEVLNA